MSIVFSSVLISFSDIRKNSVRVPFYGDYVSIRRNPAWKETLKQNHLSKRDKHVVFADVVDKMNRSTGKVNFELRGEARFPFLVPH